MSSSIQPRSNFPYPIIDDAVCTIINDYLACASEADEALCLQKSQSKESLDKQKHQTLKNIWRAYLKNITPKNSLLEARILKYSQIPESHIIGRFYALQEYMEESILSKPSLLVIKAIASINQQFMKSPFNLHKLQALTHLMNEKEEFTNLKKIAIWISESDIGEEGEVWSPIDIDDCASLQEWFIEHQEQICACLSLDLSNQDLTMIPEFFLKIFIRDSDSLLKSINLSSNRLESLPEDFGENWKQLKEIDLSGNKLGSLPDSFGKNWKQLKELKLTDNQLSTLPCNFGSNWAELEIIDLIANQFQTLPEDFGDKWPKLKGIQLSDGRLQSLPNNFGRNWHLLTTIGISNSLLENLPVDFGENWKNLRFITLNKNNFQDLPNNFGIFWTRLKMITLQSNPDLKNKSANFGVNWPPGVEVHLDAWFQIEPEDDKPSQKVINESQSSSIEASMEEEKESESSSVQNASQSKVSRKKNLEESQHEEEQPLKKTKFDSSSSNMED